MEQTTTTKINWSDIGKELRTGADDAHEGVTPDIRIAYSFLLDNPECFGFEEWPEDMPQRPNIELIAAYFGDI